MTAIVLLQDFHLPKAVSTAAGRVENRVEMWNCQPWAVQALHLVQAGPKTPCGSDGDKCPGFDLLVSKLIRSLKRKVGKRPL